MYYLASVHQNGMAVHLTRSDWRVLRSAVYPMQWMGLMICCGMAVKMVGMCGACVKNMETVTQIDKGR
jgi:hypothetical protein